MITLYLKKPIQNFSDLNWLENEILNISDFNSKVEINIKVMGENKMIDEMVKTMLTENSGWRIKSNSHYVNDKGHMLSPTGNKINIFNLEEQELEFYR